MCKFITNNAQRLSNINRWALLFARYSLLVTLYSLLFIFCFDVNMLVVSNHQFVVILLLAFAKASTDVVEYQVYQWYDNQRKEE